MGQTVTRFFELFAWASSPEGYNTEPVWIEARFPLLVEQGPLHLWRPAMPIPEEGTRLLLGVATWSGYDMHLLDVVADSLRRRPQEALTVEVFDVAACRKATDFRKFIPKLRQVFHTPVVGVWVNGEFAVARQGQEARDSVARQFGSSSDEITKYVQDWINARSPMPS